MMDLTGKLLIAPPIVKGNFWYKTVIMMTEHDADGSIGIILNKPSNIPLMDFGKELGIDLGLTGYMHLGGPLNVKSLCLLHTSEWSSKNTMIINDKFSISSDDSILPRLSTNDCPNKWRVFLGVCGWGPRQLENEILGKKPHSHEASWCVSSATEDLLFNYNNKSQWSKALDQSGLEFARSLMI